MNELSNTIDLQSTIIRAEGLFRRFQRTVEVIDKKHNFPAPSVRQRKPGNADQGGPSSAATGIDASKSMGKAVAQGGGAEKPKAISPELRQLLSRNIVTLDKKDIVEHGGGIN